MVKVILIALCILIGSHGFASYDENARRCLSSHELLMSLQAVFYKTSFTGDCGKLTEINRSFLGDSQALTGSPVSGGPNQNLVQWMSLCVKQAFNAGFTNNFDSAFREQMEKNILGTDASAIVRKWSNPSGSVFAILLQSRRVVDEPLLVEKMIAHQVRFFLGPDETIRDFGLISAASAYRETLYKSLISQPDTNISDAMKKLTIHLMLRDEFLCY